MATIPGTLGPDTLTGTSGSDTIFGNTGADLLIGLESNDQLGGGGDNDTLIGGEGADTLLGGNGTLDMASYATATSGVQVALDGSLVGTGDAQGDSISGVEGLIGSDFGDTLVGNLSDNLIIGGTGDDQLSGKDGNDTLIGGAGADTFDGGVGLRDVASYAGALVGVSVQLDDSLAGTNDAAGDVFINVEDLVGSDFNDILSGNTASNIVSGGLGNDLLYGRWGTDTLQGGSGNDTLAGGQGADWLDGGDGAGDVASYQDSSNAVQIALDGSLTVIGDAIGDILSGIEGLIGTPWNDTLAGDAAANVIDGAYGDDLLFGGTGDTVLGGQGNDTIKGVLGGVSYDGGAGHDLLDLSGATAGVTMALGLGALAQGIEDVIAPGFYNEITGDAGDNSIVGGGAGGLYRGMDGNDTLTNLLGGGVADGGTGDDLIDVGDYILVDDSSRISGGDGNDTLIGGVRPAASSQVDTIRGDAGDDLLIGPRPDVPGHLAPASIDGGSGNDTIEIFYQGGTFDGGDGFDLLDVSGLKRNIGFFVDLKTGDFFAINAGTIKNFEGVNVGSESWAASGTDGDNLLIGELGSQTLIGRGGDDTVIGGAGGDTMNGGAASLAGDGGRDLLSYETATSDVQVALDGSLTQVGDAAGDSIQSFEDLRGSDHNDTLAGDAGDNSIIGGLGDDLLFGRGGDDVFIGDAGADTMDGEAGNDLVSYAAASAAIVVAMDDSLAGAGDALGDVLIGVERILGSGFDDTLGGDALGNGLDGAVGDDSLRGQGGDDTLTGGSGADILDGGAGTGDIADYGTANGAVQAALDLTLAFTGDAAGDVYAGIEGLSGSAFNDTLKGDGGANDLRGAAGSDWLIGGLGNDTLEGGAGADVLDGGGGVRDVASYAHAAAGVQVALDGSLAAGGDAAGDVLADIEDLVGSAFADTLGGSSGVNILSGGDGDDVLSGIGGNDTLVGGNGADALSGGTGNDSLDGGAGNDTLDGGAGNDQLAGGADDDTYVVNSLSDVVTELAGGGHDRIRASVNWTLGAEVEDLVLFGAAKTGAGNGLDNAIFGSDIANSLSGKDGADTLSGAGGADTLDGGTGADSMQGGTGSDLYLVDDAGDVVDETGGSGIDEVRASITFTLGAGIENLTLLAGAGDGTGNGLNNAITGNADKNLLQGLGGQDLLKGGGGGDTLSGGNGNDTLEGGAGSDSLDGGAGNDLFLWSVTTHGNDTINGFIGAEDDLAFSAAGFGGGLVAGVALTAAQFETNSTGAASTTDVRFVFNKADGMLRYDSNGSDTGGVVVIATFTGGATVTAADIVIIA